MGIDLGTVNTLIYLSGRGIVLDEPSVLAIDRSTGKPLAFGKAARDMLGRTPASVQALRPLRHGAIADFVATETMLKHFIQEGHGGQYLISPRIVISAPSGVTQIERRAVMEAASLAGAREVHLIDEPVSAAIGAGLPVTDPVGSMIVDIGGGTTEVAVIALGGVVVSESVRVAGNDLTDAIATYLRKVYGLVVGERAAEELKLRIGSAYPTRQDLGKHEVRGLHLPSGLPRSFDIDAAEVRESMADRLKWVVEAVRRTLERTPPELAADVADRGIFLAGGGALLRGLDELIAEATGMPVHVAERPLECVVLGTGRVLENFSRFKRVFSASLERPGER